MSRQKLRSALLIAAAGVLLAAAPAAGATRYASPTGTGPHTTCDVGNPCSIADAVGAPSVQDGDEVVVLPGAYTVNTDVIASKAITVHGQGGQPTPTINMTPLSFGFYVTAAATIRDLNINNVDTGNNQRPALNIEAAGALVERVSAHAVDNLSPACVLQRGSTIRDSVCWATGSGSRGVSGNFGGVGAQTVRLRNVTASGASYGVAFNASGGTNYTVDARNVVAIGGTADALAVGLASSAVQIDFTNSNFDVRSMNPAGGTATITEPGTGTNQTAAPIFVDAAAGNFHQQSSSPTVDAGTLDGFTGSTDIDGQPRTMEGNNACPTAPDIGADELQGPADCLVPDPPTPADTTPPDTTITKAPKKKIKSKKKKKKAKISVAFSSEAGAKFECALDRAVFASCSSPFNAKVSKGKHAFSVRAIDAAGNVDATPATSSFKVKVKKKPKK